MLRFPLLLLLAATLLSPSTSAQPDGATKPVDPLLRARQTAQQITITRDEFGVPHISAPTDAAAVFGGLYARAEDEMARIESGHALSIGLASLLLGPDALPWDRFVLSFEVPDLARREYGSAPADVRALAEAAADALNFYLSLHPDYHPKAIERWEPWMFFAREYSWALYQAQQEARRVAAENPLPAPVTEPVPAPIPPPAEAPPTPDGSNAWAIGPSRTASGHAMLYINPHIPLDEVYELDLCSDQGLHISGLVAYGAGLIPMAGFNDRLGWSLTVNYPDIADTYAVEFNIPDDPLAYKHGDQFLHATRWTTNVKVKTAAGIEDRELTFVKTHHGPVVYQAGGKSFAIRVARIENLRSFEQWYRMATARDLASWKAAVSISGVVFHNLIYADADGNIGYLYNAASPRRDPAFKWGGTLDGSDPRTDWLGYHTLDDLPQVWNPPCGYVQNCNSPPFVTAADGQNPVASQFPAGMVGKDLTDGRIAMSHAILSAAHDWTLADLEAAAFDTKVYSLEPSRASLLAEYQKLHDATPEKVTAITPAIDLVRAWDGRLSSDSVASTLFMVWVENLFSPAWAKRRAPGDLCAAFAEVLTDLERDFGDWRVPWGQINRHQRFDTNAGLLVGDARDSLPILGGHGALGVSFCYLTRAQGTKHRYGYHGSSYVAAVEFGNPVAARTIVPFGSSRDPASEHFADQAPLYASGHMKPARFTPAQVATVARRTYHPGE